MFLVHLLVKDPVRRGYTCVDLDGPNASDSDPREALRRILPLRESKHVGVQVFDTTQWEFSDEILFEGNFDFDGEV